MKKLILAILLTTFAVFGQQAPVRGGGKSDTEAETKHQSAVFYGSVDLRSSPTATKISKATPASLQLGAGCEAGSVSGCGEMETVLSPLVGPAMPSRVSRAAGGLRVGYGAADPAVLLIRVGDAVTAVASSSPARPYAGGLERAETSPTYRRVDSIRPMTIGQAADVPPVITSWSPGSGNPGTAVTLVGTGFGATQGSSFVSVLSAVDFHTWTVWPATSWSDTQIVATVPSNMPLGKVLLAVTVGGLRTDGTSPFTVGVPPAITNWSPPYGNPGTTVTIGGTGFGATQGTSFVSVLSAVDNLTTTVWPATSWSDTQIVATVPGNMALGKVYMTVTVNDLQSIGTQPFTVGTPPVIQCYSPGFGPPGTAVTISGTGFGATQGASLVSVLSATDFHTWTVWPTISWSDTRIVASVPSGMPLGKVLLTVTTGGLQSIGTLPFTVGIPPAITSYSPPYGNPGTTVTIGGTGFGATQGTSFVSVLSAVDNLTTTVWPATSWSDTQIVATVPGNMALGKVYMAVTVNDLESIGTQPFTVGIPPAISGYSPDAGPAGTQITINGTGFGGGQGSGFVTLQSGSSTFTALTVLTWNDSRIVVSVPELTPVGMNFLLVTSRGLQSIGAYPFCVQGSAGSSGCP